MNTERPGDDEAVRPRRRRSPVAVASVAATAVLLVGGGGAYLAVSASGGEDQAGSGTPGGDGTPTPLVLDGYTVGGASGIAPGEPDPHGARYRANGKLPDGPSSAPVYRAKGEVTVAEVAALAKALGVAGRPTAEGDGWQVGATRDGSGQSLQVRKGKAPGIWTFRRFAPGTDGCVSTTRCASDSPPKGAAGSESSDIDPVSVGAAKKAAAPVFKAVGQDDAKLDASRLMGAVRVVNADPEVGGLPTYGWTTRVQVGADRQVVGGSGRLKTPVKSDTYPVLGAQKTLDLLNGSGAGDGRMGIGGCAEPVRPKDRNETPCEPTASQPESEAVVVERATFGLASHFVDGRQALVPSWLFDVRPEGAKESFTVTHPAVEPKYLTAPAERPGDTAHEQPGPRPTDPSGPSEPGDEPSTAPKQRDVKVEGYSADGKELTVRFTGGVCSDYSASAEERGDTVTVRVTQTPWKDKVCIMIAKIFHKTIELKEPLGDRKVVGKDGKALPLEKDLPKPTTRWGR